MMESSLSKLCTMFITNYKSLPKLCIKPVTTAVSMKDSKIQMGFVFTDTITLKVIYNENQQMVCCNNLHPDPITDYHTKTGKNLETGNLYYF